MFNCRFFIIYLFRNDVNFLCCCKKNVLRFFFFLKTFFYFILLQDNTRKKVQRRILCVFWWWFLQKKLKCDDKYIFCLFVVFVSSSVSFLLWIVRGLFVAFIILCTSQRLWKSTSTLLLLKSFLMLRWRNAFFVVVVIGLQECNFICNVNWRGNHHETFSRLRSSHTLIITWS